LSPNGHLYDGKLAKPVAAQSKKLEASEQGRLMVQPQSKAEEFLLQAHTQRLKNLKSDVHW
jgi:hypothetical protein